jgi:hypothetical protein
MNQPLPSEVIAALLWDRPQLDLVADEGAQAFVAALDPSPYRGTEGGDTPLAIAAAAVAADRSGESAIAREGYSTLADLDDRWVSLLGLMLRCWSPGAHEPDDLDRAASLVSEVHEPALRARLMMKLATYALDKQDIERFVSFVQAAYEAAPIQTRLRYAIAIVIANYSGGFPSEADRAPTDPDPLVDYDWIDALAMQSARNELVELLKARARNPWSWSVSMGRTNADVAISAELQATWAGALWLRDPIRKQLAAQLLSQPSPSSYQTLFGLSMWLAARGDDVVPILAAAEPSFDQTTADALALPLLPLNVIPAYRNLVVETATALWDVLSDDAVVAVMRVVMPETSEAPFRQGALFWSRALLRVPDRWGEAIERLDTDQLAQVAAQLSVTAVDRLEPSVAQSLLEKVAVSEGEVGSLGLILLWHKLGLPIPEGVTVPLDVVVRVATWKPEAVVDPSYVIAERVLRDSLSQTVQSALSGTFGFGPSPAGGLASVASARGAIEDESVELLIAVAEDAELAPHLRLDAAVAVAELVGSGLVGDDQVERFAALSPPSGPPIFGPPVSASLLSSAALAVRAHVLTDEEQGLLFTLSRDPDTRAREIVARVAAIFLRTHHSASVEAALAAALFDPEPSVVNAALRSLRDVHLSDLSHDAVTARLLRIFQQYSRYERAEVVRAAAGLQRSTRDDVNLAQVLIAARSDRSWIVRDAATEAERQSVEL